MREFVMLGCVVACSWVAYSAQVLWDAFETIPGTSAWLPEIHLWKSNGEANYSIEMIYLFTQNELDGGWTFKIEDITHSGVVYEAPKGSVVNQGSATSSPSVLASRGDGAMPREQWKTISGNEAETFYLAITGNNSPFDAQVITVYGWLEFEVTDAGGIQLLHSAIDLDGGPMIVGGGSAIPEPSSGLLFLMGALYLIMRRTSRA